VLGVLEPGILRDFPPQPADEAIVKIFDKNKRNRFSGYQEGDGDQGVNKAI
jgi:hypothetical protein